MGTEVDELLQEREELSRERLLEIQKENILKEPFLTYFQQCAGVILGTLSENRIHYEDEAIASNYLGVLYGRLFSLLYAKILEEANEFEWQKPEHKVIFSELLIEIYNLMEQEIVWERQISEIIYWFLSDYSELFVLEDLVQLQKGREPKLEQRIWALFGDKKYKERYLQAFYQALESWKGKTIEFLPIIVGSDNYEMSEKKMALMLKMKEERQRIMGEFHENNF